jgi:hypothetical protein
VYQPKIKDPHIRRLYFLAKRERKKMTQVLNEILAEYLADEPEPPPYEPQWMRYQPSPDYAKRTERAIHKMMRDYHGGNDEQVVHRRADVCRVTVDMRQQFADRAQE